MKSKVVAGLFGIFLGGLGIHKFYLGRMGWGIVYLLFCWTLIPGIAGFIEGIIYLTMSDDAFNIKYNGGLSPIGSQAAAMDGLAKLTQLKESGVISDEEYESRRKSYLDRF